MGEEGSIFEKYTEEKRGISNRIRQPKFWINIILGIAVIGAAVMIFRSCKSAWSSDQVKRSLSVTWYETGWKQVKTKFERDKVKIIPVMKIRVKNIGDEPLHYVDFEAVFNFSDTGRNHTSGYSRGIQTPLDTGKESDEIFIEGTNGYTASSIEAFTRNKKNWKLLNVKLFARTRGSPPVKIGSVYKVEQKIQKLKNDELKDEKDNPLYGMLKIGSVDTGWIYKKTRGGDVIIFPVIDISAENSGTRPIDKLIFSGVFSFEKSGDSKHSGYPIYSKTINPGGTSEKISLRAQLGIRSASLQSLYNNVFSWEKVSVKIYAREAETGFIFLGKFDIKKEVRGVRVIKE